MSKLPEAVIEAASSYRDSQDLSEWRARRVIIELAENLPESAIKKAAQELIDAGYDPEIAIAVASISIIAALKDLGGDNE